MQVLDTLSNFSAALEPVFDALRALESGAVDLALGADRVRHELREAIVASNGVSALSASSGENLSAVQRVRVSVDVGELRGYLVAAAIAWEASTSRRGEGYLSRIVAATAGARKTLELVESTIRSLEERLGA
jgi:hypothetical protein